MTSWGALPVAPALLGESPFWHPEQQALYWCDIAGKRLHRFTPASAAHREWSFDSEPCSCAPLADGGVLLAMRDGLFRFDPERGKRTLLAAPPYDPTNERYNDGKADPQGRWWCGTIFEPRSAPAASLYRWSQGQLQRMAGAATVANGLAFSPDGLTLYWSDTSAHRIDAFDFDGADGTISRRRCFARFDAKPADGAATVANYRGRPDGAAVDSEGAYWVAMYEGQRLLRLAADGSLLDEIELPVRCPTMPCFGGADLRTLYVTTARQNRPADELSAQPWAGCVLTWRVAVAGLPVHFARA